MDVSMEILDMPEQDKATTKFQATDVLLNGSALFLNVYMSYTFYRNK